MRAAQRRRALDELEAVGQEDADERAHAARRAGARPAHRRPSGASPRRARSRRSARARRRGRGRRPRPGPPAASKRTTSRSFDGPAGAPRAAEVQRLEEVRLARAVRPVDDGEPLAQRDVGALRSVRKSRRRRRVRPPTAASDVQADRHDQVEEAAAVGGLDRPGRSGLMSLRTTSSAPALSRPAVRKSGLKPISNGSPANGMGSGSLASPTSGVCAETLTSPSVKLAAAARSSAP